MNPSQFSEKVQLLAFVLQSGSEWNPNVLEAVQRVWGNFRHLGKLFPFNKTSYYEKEMGSDLYRGVVSFETEISPENIGLEKKKSNDLEQSISVSLGKRDFNIDIGYMDLDKVVLPSYKRGPFKIYAGNGIWLDMLLTYAKGKFLPTMWAFEDFKRNPYEHDLLLIRERFKKAKNKK